MAYEKCEWNIVRLHKLPKTMCTCKFDYYQQKKNDAIVFGCWHRLDVELHEVS